MPGFAGPTSAGNFDGRCSPTHSFNQRLTNCTTASPKMRSEKRTKNQHPEQGPPQFLQCACEANEPAQKHPILGDDLFVLYYKAIGTNASSEPSTWVS